MTLIFIGNNGIVEPEEDFAYFGAYAFIAWEHLRREGRPVEDPVMVCLRSISNLSRRDDDSHDAIMRVVGSLSQLRCDDEEVAS
jgi:hypothetical protein